MNQLRPIEARSFACGSKVYIAQDMENGATNTYFDLNYLSKNYGISVDTAIKLSRCNIVLEQAIKLLKIEEDNVVPAIELNQLPDLLLLLNISCQAPSSIDEIKMWKEMIELRKDILGECRDSFEHLKNKC